MKKSILVMGAFMLASLLHAQTAPVAATPNQPKDIAKVIEFKELDHDFGKIPYGKAVTYDVPLKNISEDSVKIENVQVGCGCTTPKWQAGPYAPGENFKISLGFNGYTEGNFNKVVTVYFNNGLSQVVKFHGETFKVPDNAAPANAAVQKLKPLGN